MASESLGGNVVSFEAFRAQRAERQGDGGFDRGAGWERMAMGHFPGDAAGLRLYGQEVAHAQRSGRNGVFLLCAMVRELVPEAYAEDLPDRLWGQGNPDSVHRACRDLAARLDVAVHGEGSLFLSHAPGARLSIDAARSLAGYVAETGSARLIRVAAGMEAG